MREKMMDEQLTGAIVAASSDAIMFADREGIIRLWNSGAEKMFGFSAAEALGQSLDLIIPENLRGRHWDGYGRVMESGSSRYSTDLLSTPALRKDGTRFPLRQVTRSPECDCVFSTKGARNVPIYPFTSVHSESQKEFY